MFVQSSLQKSSLKKNKYDLTTGSIWKTVLYFAIPIFLGTFFQSLYTTTDAIIIGKFAGKGALAAIESVYTLTKIPINFFTGLSAGATIMISQYIGGKKEGEVSEASHNAVFFAFVGGVFLAVIGCLFSSHALSLIQVPGEIMKEAHHYILIYFTGLIASMVYNMGAGILRALGNSKTPFNFLMISNIVNVVLDIVLIVFFQMGVVGAAIATVVSQFCSMALVLGALIRTSLPCKISLRRVRFYRRYMGEVFRLGLPVGLQSTLYPISNTIVQTSINSMGVNAIAAWAVCGKLDFLVWSISDAFGVAASTFVAQNYGAGQYSRARRGVRAVLISALISVAAVSSILYFGSAALAAFLIDDIMVIDTVSRIMYLIAPFYAVYVFCDVLPSALRGMGDTLMPMLITLIGTSATRVLWVFFIVPLQPNLMTVLTCYPVSWGITALVFILYYFKKISKFKMNEE